MLNRRRFLQTIAAAAATPALTYSCQTNQVTDMLLPADPNRILDLQHGFSYTIVSRYGDSMNDGLIVPAAHDGMAAFEGEDGRVILICNHELGPTWKNTGPFGDQYAELPDSLKECLYDRGGDTTPGLGGTTTTVYNPATRTTERQFLSLAGTELNCAGGPTPWGSWLSCEECFEKPGAAVSKKFGWFRRDQRHGYVFEVPASATALVPARPLKDMGRFKHEAAAVHEPTGIVYLTEDDPHSLFYRFLPNVPGQLHRGGRLQALAIASRHSLKTHNWHAPDMRVNMPLTTRWIDLQDVDSDKHNLHKRGAAAGAASFARGEGLTVAGDQLAFTCTTGGPARLGQVFSYEPSPYEGTDEERSTPGKLTLIAEANRWSMLKNCDNLTMAPWGDLIICEDLVGPLKNCSLVGMRPDGSQYQIANNAYTSSELAGVCFSPDGKTMFLNIQYPGMTLAITGPWPS
ncbi:MAG: DUF839 domain-containing protein [Proteobacteria bacterium]|nr:DUF839 domain-containing protein [Pseudomonadota bacterium]